MSRFYKNPAFNLKWKEIAEEDGIKQFQAIIGKNIVGEFISTIEYSAYINIENNLVRVDALYRLPNIRGKRHAMFDVFSARLKDGNLIDIKWGIEK